MQRLKAETKRYFRALRGPYSEKLAFCMFNRKKLSNWLRLCKRLIAINKKMPWFRKMRSMWVIFNRWMKLVEREQMNVTPGLVDIIRRRCLLLPGYSDMLSDRGIKEIVYVNSANLRSATSEFAAVFLRWQMYIQESKVFKMLKERASSLYRLMLLNKVFYALRFALSHDDTEHIRRKNIGFPIIRLQTDLDQITKRFISLRRLGLQFIVGQYNRKFAAYTVNDARTSLSFKRFLSKFKAEVACRLTTEQRVLSECFEHRGEQEYIDIRGSRNLPNSMTRIDGKRFSDPYIPDDEFGKGCWVPSGYKLSCLRLNMHRGVEFPVLLLNASLERVRFRSK